MNFSFKIKYILICIWDDDICSYFRIILFINLSNIVNKIEFILKF